MADAVSSSTAAVAATASQSAASSSGQGTGIADAALADYDDFLTLLTAQLRNQDPLNPQDGAEFVEQIATFTTVEQQMNANDKLDQLIEATVASSMSDLASWVGLEVSAEDAAYSFNGSSLSIPAPSDSSAVSAKAIIKNADGQAVAELAYDPSSAQTLAWDGSTTSGSTAAAGSYYLDFEMTHSDGKGGVSTELVTVADFAKVVEARIVDNAPSLVLETGRIIAASDVSATRAASGG